MARLHTAGSCREHSCSMALPHWQGLRNVSTGAQVGPGLPLAAPSPSELCPAWLCTPKKLVGFQCPCPICPAVLTAQWCGSLGRDCGGSMQDISCPSPMNTSSWECGMPGFGGPLALLCSFPCYQNGKWRLCSCREGGRKVQLLWGRSIPPASQPRGPEQGWAVRVLGSVLSLRTTCTSACSCSAPLNLPT